jgi:D-sedoheptulose 7-phosphate isomerase
MTTSHSERFLQQVSEIAESVDHEAIERIALGLADLRERRGRLFVIGVGGSASNSSHAVSDFRKLARIEAYAPTDNVSELTARTNDEGWDTVFTGWLDISQANGKDAVFILSVGGGDLDRNVSPNIVRAVDEAKKRGMQVYGIVGRDGGYTKRLGDEVIVIPTVDSNHITPLSESFQAIVWHCLVFHPNLILLESKWESMGKGRPS